MLRNVVISDCSLVMCELQNVISKSRSKQITKCVRCENRWWGIIFKFGKTSWIALFESNTFSDLKNDRFSLALICCCIVAEGGKGGLRWLILVGRGG